MHAPFMVPSVTKILNNLVASGYIGMTITVHEHYNAVVHVIGAKVFLGKVIHTEIDKHRVCRCLEANLFYPKTFHRNHETFSHNDGTQGSDVVFVAELFTFCREVFFRSFFSLFLKIFPTFCFTLRVIRSRERNIEICFLERIFYESSNSPSCVRSYIVLALVDKTYNH